MPEALPDPPGQPADAGRARAALLLELLEDDSPVVLAAVRRELERLGGAGTAALRRAARDGSPLLRGRARQLLLDRARRDAVRRLVRYASRPDHDLEAALFLLDAHGAPGRDLRGHRRALDAFADEVRARLEAGLAPPGALAEVLGEGHGFSGAAQDFHHPDNILLHRTIERRQGMPLTLCAIYVAVARRAGIGAGILPFPGHVLLSVENGDRQTVLDPFSGGERVTRSRALEYLDLHGLAARREYFRAASDGAMFLRHVRNLIHSCALRGRGAEVAELKLVLRVLSRHVEHGRRMPRGSRA